MTCQLRISLFGYLKVEQDGQPPIPIHGQKVAALLAYLACNPTTHSRSQLAEFFWATAPPQRRLANLRSTLNRLPKVFKQHLHITTETITFEPTVDIWIDVLVFQALAASLPTNPDRASLESMGKLLQITDQLVGMVQLYTGAFLEGPTINDEPSFTEWHLTQQAHLESLAVTALRHLIYLCMQQGHYREGLVYAERLMALDPLDEEARRRQMQLLAYSGEVQAAKQAYQTLVAMLEEEFGAPPEPETVATYRRVLARDGTAPSQTATFPYFTQPLIGRAVELATLLHLLQQATNRLVTITGLGGMGKTYLAVEAARRLEARRDFADGVVYLSLASLQSGAQLPAMLRQALGLSRSEQTDLSAQICAYLAEKTLLIVLDNFEHLLTTSATPRAEESNLSARHLVQQMLQAAPQVKILVTSRQPLSLPQEVCYALDGLSLPPMVLPVFNDAHASEIELALPSATPKAIMDDSVGDAIQLFQQVARHNDSTFTLTPVNQAAVYRFCQLVQGMPLAIILGAAHMGFLSPQELVDECTRDLDLFTTDWHDLPDRHRSVRVIFDYSWQQLDESARQLFARLSIFPASFTNRAAQQIADATPIQLRRLVNQSLLVQTTWDRYDIHALLRNYAADKLTTLAHSDQAIEQLNTRHMQYYLEWLGEQAAALQGPQPFVAAATIHPELPNIQQAWTYSLQQKAIPYLTKALIGLEVYCDIQGLYQEGLTLIDEAIQALQRIIPAQPNSTIQFHQQSNRNWIVKRTSENTAASLATYLATYCQLLTSQSYFHNRLGNVDQALQLIEHALHSIEQLSSAQNLSHPLDAVEQVQLHRSASSPADNIHRHAQRERDILLAKVYWTWGESLLWCDEFAAAKAKADQAVALAEQVADQNLLAWSLHLRGGVYFHLDQFAQATVDIQQAYAISQRIDHAHNQVNHLDTLGQINYATGKLSTAKGYLEKALEISSGLGDEQTKYAIYWTLCRIALRLGDYDAAETYALQALHFFLKIGNPREASYFYYDLGKLYNKTGLYQKAEEHLDQGARLAETLGLRSEQAHIFLEQSMTAQGRGETERALTLLNAAMKIAKELAIDDLHGDILTQCAALWRRRGDLAQSIALYNQALATYPAIPNHLPFGAKAGLAHAYQQNGDAVAATHLLQEVITYLTGNPETIHLLQTPFTTYLDCYHVLHAQQDPQAASILDAAHTLLHDHASNIHKPAQRRAFFAHVADHHEIMQLYAAESRA